MDQRKTMKQRKSGKRFQYNGEIGGWEAQQTGGLNTGSHEEGGTPAPTSAPTGNANKPVPMPKFQIPLDNEGIMCMSCRNPYTENNNIFYLTYPGGNNPLNWLGDADYTAIPSSLADYPAIGHDRRYDKLKIKGLSGLLFDTRAIGADAIFVSEQMEIAYNPTLPLRDRIQANILGSGLGACALGKTLIKLSQGPKAFQETMMYFIISNYNKNGLITNTPDTHNHEELKKKLKD